MHFLQFYRRPKLNKPQPTSDETQTRSVKSRPASGKSRNRKPIKQYFLIGSMIGLVTGISFVFLDTHIINRIVDSHINEENLQKDLERDFLLNLRKDLRFSNLSNLEDADSDVEDTDPDSEDIGVSNKYQYITDRDALLNYIDNEYVNSYIIRRAPDNYNFENLRQRAKELVEKKSLNQKSFSKSVCGHIQFLIATNIGDCLNYFNDDQGFNRLMKNLDETNKNNTARQKINQKIGSIQGYLDSNLKKMNQDERIKFLSDLLFPGMILVIVSTAFLLPTTVVYIIDRIKQREEKIVERSEKVEKAKDSFAKTPWQSASTVLGDYYDRNLQQITKIYNTSLLAIWFGFGLIVVSIGFGIHLAGKEDLTEQENNRIEILKNQDEISKLSQEQLEIIMERPEGNSGTVITLIGVGAGIISNFVGATFLFLYQATLKQASEYTQGLSKTNTVGISMAILAELTKEQQEKQKEQALLEGYSPQDTNDKIANTKLEISKLVIAQLQSLKESGEKNGHVNIKS